MVKKDGPVKTFGRGSSFQEFISKAEKYNSPKPRFTSKIDAINKVEVEGRPSNNWVEQDGY